MPSLHERLVAARSMFTRAGIDPEEAALDAELLARHALGWDRATVLHERSLEIFEALGVAEPFLAEGVRTWRARFHSDGVVLGELGLDVISSRYGFQVGISTT